MTKPAEIAFRSMMDAFKGREQSLYDGLREERNGKRRAQIEADLKRLGQERDALIARATGAAPPAAPDYGETDLVTSAMGGQAKTGKEGHGEAEYETKLSPQEESAFKVWKSKYAPNDSGQDYDLRGAFKAGLKPGANGHFSDRFKKPNHPTFSNESQYAKERPELAGRWEGETYIPPNGGGYGPVEVRTLASGERVRVRRRPDGKYEQVK